MGREDTVPFVRNRYYPGKLLTSGDFETEQGYMNGKRQFINSTMFGCGIAHGLGVCMMDEQSVRIEAGCAIDSEGREVVVPAAVTKKLSTVSGFKDVGSADALLCLRFREEAVHSVFCGSAPNGKTDYEYNHMEEGYELYLTDTDADGDSADGKMACLFQTGILADTDDYLAYVKMPAAVPRGKAVKIELDVYKKSDTDNGFSLNMKVSLPLFTDTDGRNELLVTIEKLLMEKGGHMHREYWINPLPTDAAQTSILISKRDVRLTIGDAEKEPGGDIKLGLEIMDMTPYELSVWELGRSKGVRAGQELVLAYIGISWVDDLYKIDGVWEQGFKRYIVTPGQADRRNRYMSFFRNPVRDKFPTDPQTGLKSELPGSPVDSGTAMACGELEIPLDVEMKKGDICYSEEIMHGLGRGNVYVEAGLGYLEDSFGRNRPYKHTIYGNSELFPEKETMSVETAVDVNHDKGSFRIAARLLGEQNSVILKYNWVAVKFRTAADAYAWQDEAEGSIAPLTPTVRVKAKESHLFQVSFHDMLPCRLVFELTEPGSGDITQDGLYTAPAKEGVYEISISCAEMPSIHTYAYAVVSR